MNLDREAFDPGHNLANCIDERRVETDQHNCWLVHGLDDPLGGDEVRGRTRYEDRRTSVGKTLLLVGEGSSIALSRPRINRGCSAGGRSWTPRVASTGASGGFSNPRANVAR